MAEMKALQFGTFPYFHPYEIPLSPKVLRLAQELGSLATSLPLSFESSIFVRVDEARMDEMRAVIMGPSGSPYSGGTH
jgi:baculoviral IAP repeat-containing protein 6